MGLADLLIRQKRPGRALSVVRQARSRTLGWARVSQALSRLPTEPRAQWNKLLGEYRRLRTALDAEIEDDWKRSRVELEAIKQSRVSEEKLALPSC